MTTGHETSATRLVAPVRALVPVIVILLEGTG
jgi:hypothetical protein